MERVAYWAYLPKPPQELCVYNYGIKKVLSTEPICISFTFEREQEGVEYIKTFMANSDEHAKDKFVKFAENGFKL